jgi:hypothetical protein
MPAVSKAQRRYFGWLDHNPGQAKAEGVGRGLTHQQMHDFASTPEKGLPERVSPKMSYRRRGEK